MARHFSHIDVSDILPRLKSVGFCLDCTLTSGHSLVFDSFLSLFLKEVYLPPVLHPIPALIGAGIRVDLHQLHLAVMRRGGSMTMNKRKSWRAVTEEMKLDPSLAPSIKLVYYKYLDPLEKWLPLVGEEMESESDKKGGPNIGNNDRFLSLSKQTVSQFNTKRDCIVVSDRIVQDITSSEKLVNPVDMLNLLKKLASSSHCFDLRELLQSRNGRKVGVCLGQLLLVRVEKQLKSNYPMDCIGSSSQKEQEIHDFSVYSDDQKGAKRRGDNLLQSPSKLPRNSPYSNEVECDPMDSVDDVSGSNQKPCYLKLLANIFDVFHNKDQIRLSREISLGESYQACIQEWTVEDPKSDLDSLKWLGDRTWPLDKGADNPSMDLCTVGKGRESLCSCNLSGSVECVRLHVAEKGFHLKHELVSAFKDWKFDEMGEEVSLLWTEEDEKEFKGIMIEIEKSSQEVTWNHLRSRLPLKKHEDLVSYYFNVFFVRRRSYQNRVIPNKIDSDSNRDFSFLSTRFNQPKVQDHKLS